MNRILQTLAFNDDAMLQHHERNVGVPCRVRDGGELFRINKFSRSYPHISALVEDRLQYFVKRGR